MTRHKLRNCPHCGGNLLNIEGDVDSRERPFRVRVRLYDTLAANKDDPMAGADSAEGLDAGADGTDILKGLPTVLAEAAFQAHAFHMADSLHGFQPVVIQQKLNSARVGLSRTGGRTVIRIPYNTSESFSDGQRPPRYLCRIDVVREATAPQES